jgi:hypothetical protein
MNQLANGSFEAGWKDEGSAQVPNGWAYWYARRTFSNWIDSSVAAKFSAPEVRHLTRDDLPESEHDLFFFDDSDTTLKIFAPKYKTCWAALRQAVDVPAGLYRLTIPLFPDVINKKEDGEKKPAPDPQSGMMRWIINDWARHDNPDGWFTMQPFLEPHWYTKFFEWPGGELVVGAEWVFPHPLGKDGGSAGIFTDAWELIRVGDIEPPENEKYERVVHLLPQEVTADEVAEVMAVALGPRQSLTFSAHDAFITHDDLIRRTVVVWAVDRWGGKDALEGWVLERYPPLPETFYKQFSQQPTPEPPEPEPPAPTKLGEHISFHRQTNIDGLYQFIADVKPALVKLVGGIEDSKRVKDACSTTLVDYRHVVRHQGQYIDTLNIHDFLELFRPTLERHMQWVDVFEGVNEEPPNAQLAAWSSALSDEVYRRYGEDCGVCLMNLAVGNGQPQVLLPVAKAADRNGHWIGYHSYFPCHPAYAEQWMEEVAEWYHMRHLLYLDPYFRAFGAFPRYLETEGGGVGADATVTINAMSSPWPVFNEEWLAVKNQPLISADDDASQGVGGLDPAGGWRSEDCLNGDRDRYYRLLLRLREKVGEWNAEHNNRAEGCTLFTVGDDYVGWRNYKFWTDDINALSAVLA